MITDKYSIVEQIAKDKVVENIISNIDKTEDDTLKDLAQEILLDLLMKPDDKIIQLYNDNQLQYFITRMVLNSIKSKTSRYYYLFARHNDIYEEITNER